jgi:hypothetical protein
VYLAGDLGDLDPHNIERCNVNVQRYEIMHGIVDLKACARRISMPAVGHICIIVVMTVSLHLREWNDA